jgi:hypothetical protein
MILVSYHICLEAFCHLSCFCRFRFPCLETSWARAAKGSSLEFRHDHDEDTSKAKLINIAYGDQGGGVSVPSAQFLKLCSEAELAVEDSTFSVVLEIAQQVDFKTLN